MELEGEIRPEPRLTFILLLIAMLTKEPEMLQMHCVHEKNYNTRHCTIEMSNLNAS